MRKIVLLVTLLAALAPVMVMSVEQLDAMRAQPAWQARVEAAHTIGRESAAVASFRLDPGAMAKITVPVLLLGGGESGEPFKSDIHAVAATLPDARVSLIPDQGHAADVFAPQLVAERILPFVRN